MFNNGSLMHDIGQHFTHPPTHCVPIFTTILYNRLHFYYRDKVTETLPLYIYVYIHYTHRTAALYFTVYRSCLYTPSEWVLCNITPTPRCVPPPLPPGG